MKEDPLKLVEMKGNGRNALHAGMEAGAPEDILLLAIESCPKALTMQDFEGNTPLHLGLHSRNSVKVLVEAIKACPKVLTVQNKDGSNALHQAMLYRAPVDAAFVIACANIETTYTLDRSGRNPAQIGGNDKIRQKVRKAIATAQTPLSLSTMTQIPILQRGCILGFFMTAKRVDDMMVKHAGSCIPKEMWWIILGMLRAGDLILDNKGFETVDN
uniref:Uncharacterized protein n=1 Tax=Helicotheca tamesis TaxID=374047 RepID=A0A6U0FHU7_9STRA|eukprot:CAMPEP_0185726018 /NCGR_PEP_ID=MMETSP1171-20130828/2124_1 /TAXON_ID=374046 /ORGANISM="Helicotheca tamensis, Strain CCMP826" /LENGTH=214 /DNA_ID=CAMNT_0028394283 /DNA_START=85 /DNA_END=729 /DNA_ORIENTATION=-